MRDRFRAPPNHARMLQPEHADHVLEEVALLARRLQQSNAPLRPRDFERQRRKARARADVDELEVRGWKLELQSRQRVQEMLADDLVWRSDARQVDLLVPRQQFSLIHVKRG